MVNVRNVVVDAYKMIGDIGDAEALDGTRSVIGTQLLNDVIYQLNLQNFFAFTMQNVEYTITASQSEYSIGVPTVDYPDVDINAQRPSTILRVYYIESFNSLPTEINQVAPQDIFRYRSNADNITTPSYYAYRPDYPLAYIMLDVKPYSGGKFVIVYNKHIPVSDINDIIEVPPEYEAALKYSLAYVLAKRYGKPMEVVVDMQSLRDEMVSVIKNNTVSRTPLVHAINQGNSRQNIYSMGIL